LSVRELSRAAGVSIGHVQYYFETYEDLIEAVLFYNSALYTAQRLLIDDDGASVRERLQARFTWLVVDAMQPDTAAYFFELWSISLKEARFARVMDANYQNVVLRVAGLIGEARPDLPDQERRQRAVLVSSHIEGLLVHFCRPRTDDLDSDAFVAKAVDTLMKLALD
jgi:AcrR family transcriptional regulator